MIDEGGDKHNWRFAKINAILFQFDRCICLKRTPEKFKSGIIFKKPITESQTYYKEQIFNSFQYELY